MKKYLLYLALPILIYGCGKAKSNENKREVSELETTETVNELTEIREASIKESLSYLSSDELQGRQFGTEGIEKAANYIQKQFKKADLKPYFSTYRDSFTHNGKTGYNMVGFKEGNDPQLKNEIIVLGAHYDHIGIVPESKQVNGDSIANGANDNAAGTASILELAKYFSAKETKRSLLFVLFSAEEEGLIGSKHLAQKLAEESAPIYVMLNFEMIGVPLENQAYSAYVTGFEESNLAGKFNQYAEKEVFGFFEKAKEFQLFKRSDNYPFYQEMNIPAQTLCTFDFSNYPYYHHVDDEAELMNVSHMKTLLEDIIPGIEGMANSAEKEIQLNNKQ
ncbi:M20/M25/M40 family metallo-hydrolase [Mesonia mobilis]|uniref:Aminopeptidase n=1 Tax=Mesonia mobilis TaxID=369791 RepID=A0ABQ3BTI3_9FLAO|nr:M20/M25/M40 family metallo-hydrolase [Mesonia mobilis]MBQ0738944.1 M20/M25/M40 family metallo-hydrolase [Aquimarina celericrescens]GGZ57027.1 aminopeptidase [Mesonia mobilis]